MGCTSSKTTEDDQFHVEYSSDQQKASHRSSTTPTLFPVFGTQPQLPALTFQQLFYRLDPHLSEAEVDLWFHATEIYFETHSASAKDRIVSPIEEAIIHKAFYGIEVTIESIQAINVKRLLASEKKSDRYIVLLKFKLTKSGWLTKLGSVVKTWKKRYFVLCEGSLKYYESDMTLEQQQRQLIKPKGEIKLTHESTIQENSNDVSQFAILFDSVTHPNGLQIEVVSESEKFDWIESIQEQISILQICQSLTINTSNFLYHMRLADKIYKLRLASPNYTNSTSGSGGSNTNTSSNYSNHIVSHTIFASKENTKQTVQMYLDNLKTNGSNLSGMIYDEWLQAIGLYFKWITYENLKINDNINMSVSQQILTIGTHDIIIKKAINDTIITPVDIENLDYSRLSQSSDYVDKLLGSNRLKLVTTGWLRKEGHIVKNWKRRFFVLSEGWIKYYEDEGQEIKKGELKLLPYSDVSTEQFDSKVLTLILNDANDTHLIMESEVLEEKIRWMSAIKEHVTWLHILSECNIGDSKMLSHFRLAEKIMKLYLASGNGSLISLLTANQSSNGQSMTLTNSAILSKSDSSESHVKLARLASITHMFSGGSSSTNNNNNSNSNSNGNSNSNSSSNNMTSTNNTSPTTLQSMKSFHNILKSGLTLGDLMLSIDKVQLEKGRPSLTRNELELWAIAIGLYFGFSDSTTESSPKWQDRVVSHADSMLLHTAICEIDLTKDEFEGFDINQFRESGKLSEQLVFLLRYQATTKGWLSKEGHFMKNWKKRYFVLNQGYLRYYEKAIEEPPYGASLKGEIKLLPNSRLDPSYGIDNKPLSKETLFVLIGGINTEDTVVEDASNSANKRYSNGTFMAQSVSSSNNYLVMESATKEDKDYWVAAVQEQIFISELLDRAQISSSNLLHYLKLSEKLLTLHVASTRYHNEQ